MSNDAHATQRCSTGCRKRMSRRVQTGWREPAPVEMSGNGARASRAEDGALALDHKHGSGQPTAGEGQCQRLSLTAAAGQRDARCGTLRRHRQSARARDAAAHAPGMPCACMNGVTRRGCTARHAGGSGRSWLTGREVEQSRRRTTAGSQRDAGAALARREGLMRHQTSDDVVARWRWHGKRRGGWLVR